MTTTEMETTTVATKSPEQRKELLARAVANQVRQGGRVESTSDYQAVLVTGSKPNHILHLILTLVTLGLWALIWIGVAILGGEKRMVIDIDEYGNTNIQK
jgi:hypothetical protein